MELTLHNDIMDRLKHFHSVGKIPNIIFHGSYASGKKYLLYKFIDLIYNNDKTLINNYVISANCAQGKGIKFVREELKFFARTNMNNNEGSTFKTIILQNADKLTIDAQSALRRCIELFSHSTRFFIIVEDKYRLLKPIISRFCEIYVPLPKINNKEMNLYHYSLNKLYNIQKEEKTTLQKVKKLVYNSKKNLYDIVDNLYDKGYSSLDIIKMYETIDPEELKIDYSKKYEHLILFQKLKKEFRHEKLCMLLILNKIVNTFDDALENIGNM